MAYRSFGRFWQSSQPPRYAAFSHPHHPFPRIALASVADHQSVPVEPLAAFAKLDPVDITVSGISSGAFFAHQFHIAFSSLVKGAGIVAGPLALLV